MVCANLLALALVVAPDLNGTWEVQSMGSDRTMVIQQKGAKVVAHRVMWPEFEGEKYKLEHLYRGTLSGKQIKGDLLVKEEELPSYEVLRSFIGTLNASGELVLDGLPLKRTGAAAPDGAPKEGTREPAKRVNEPPTLSQAPPPPPPPAAAPSEETDPAATLFANIMGQSGGEGLFTVSNSVALPSVAEDLAKEGDVLYAKGQVAPALGKYEKAAQEAGSQGGLLHRMGRCRLAMKEYEVAVGLLKRALKLDPRNADLKRDYDKAKKHAKRA